MTTTCENSVFGGLFRAWKRSRLGDILLGGRVVSMHTYDGGYFYLPRSGKVMQNCRSKIKIIKKGLMDFEASKPLFLVLFGIILSSLGPV